MRPCFPRPGIQPNNSIKALVTTAKQINNINLLNLQHLCTLLNAYWLLSQPMSLLNELAPYATMWLTYFPYRFHSSALQCRSKSQDTNLGQITKKPSPYEFGYIVP